MTANQPRPGPVSGHACGTCLHHERKTAYCGLYGTRKRMADKACREWTDGKVQGRTGKKEGE